MLAGFHQLTQNAFRGRYDNGSESGAGWIANTNTNFSWELDRKLRFRFEIVENGGQQDGSQRGFKLQCNKNSTGWQDVTATSTICRMFDSPNLTSGNSTTQQIGGGTFVSANFGQEDGDGATPWASGLNNSVSEAEFSIMFLSQNMNPLDTVQLRLIYDDGNTFGGYTQTPTVTALAPVLGWRALSVPDINPSLDLENPLARRARFAWCANSAQSSFNTSSAYAYAYDAAARRLSLGTNTNNVYRIGLGITTNAAFTTRKIDFSDRPDLQFSAGEAFTMFALVKPVDNDYGSVFGCRYLNDGFEMFWHADVFKYRFGMGSSLITAITGTTKAYGAWYTVAITHHIGVSQKLYVNGTYEASGSSSSGITFHSSNRFSLLNQLDNESFKGELAAAYIFDRELSTSEIASLSADPFQIWELVDTDGATLISTPVTALADVPSGTWSVLGPTAQGAALVQSDVPSGTWSPLSPSVTGAALVQSAVPSGAWSPFDPDSVLGAANVAADVPSGVWSPLDPTVFGGVPVTIAASAVSGVWSALAPTVDTSTVTVRPAPPSGVWSVVDPNVEGEFDSGLPYRVDWIPRWMEPAYPTGTNTAKLFYSWAERRTQSVEERLTWGLLDFYGPVSQPRHLYVAEIKDLSTEVLSIGYAPSSSSREAWTSIRVVRTYSDLLFEDMFPVAWISGTRVFLRNLAVRGVSMYTNASGIIDLAGEYSSHPRIPDTAIYVVDRFGRTALFEPHSNRVDGTMLRMSARGVYTIYYQSETISSQLLDGTTLVYINGTPVPVNQAQAHNVWDDFGDTVGVSRTDFEDNVNLKERVQHAVLAARSPMKIAGALGLAAHTWFDAFEGSALIASGATSYEVVGAVPLERVVEVPSKAGSALFLSLAPSGSIELFCLNELVPAEDYSLSGNVVSLLKPRWTSRPSSEFRSRYLARTYSAVDNGGDLEFTVGRLESRLGLIVHTDQVTVETSSKGRLAWKWGGRQGGYSGQSTFM